MSKLEKLMEELGDGRRTPGGHARESIGSALASISRTLKQAGRIQNDDGSDGNPVDVEYMAIVIKAANMLIHQAFIAWYKYQGGHDKAGLATLGRVERALDSVNKALR